MVTAFHLPWWLGTSALIPGMTACFPESDWPTRYIHIMRQIAPGGVGVLSGRFVSSYTSALFPSLVLVPAEAHLEQRCAASLKASPLHLGRARVPR